MSHVKAPVTTHLVLVWPAYHLNASGIGVAHGKFSWRCGKVESPKPSSEPLLSAARFLLDGGHAQPADYIEMQHMGSAHISLRAVVSVAAGLTVQERDDGKHAPRFAPYVPFDKATFDKHSDAAE